MSESKTPRTDAHGASSMCCTLRAQEKDRADKAETELAASHAREAQYREALDAAALHVRPTCAKLYYSLIEALTLTPPPVVPLSLAEKLADALKTCKASVSYFVDPRITSTSYRFDEAKVDAALEAWRAAQP